MQVWKAINHCKKPGGGIWGIWGNTPGSEHWQYFVIVLTLFGLNMQLLNLN